MPAFLQLRLQLQSVEPAVWRQVLVPPGLSLAELHELIQVAMGWGNYRSYRFLADEAAWGPDDLDRPEVRPASTCTVGEWLATQGQSGRYRYHMKHHWDVEVTREGEATKRSTGARLLEGAGNCPPEEVPGPMALTQVLTAQQGGPTPEDPYLAWLSDHFDAFFFSSRRRHTR